MIVGKRGTRLNHMPGGLMLRELPTFLFGLEDAAHCMWHILALHTLILLHASKGYTSNSFVIEEETSAAHRAIACYKRRPQV